MQTIICQNCQRDLPSLEYKYKEECIWCSIEYYELHHKKEITNVQK